MDLTLGNESRYSVINLMEGHSLAAVSFRIHENCCGTKINTKIYVHVFLKIENILIIISKFYKFTYLPVFTYRTKLA